MKYIVFFMLCLSFAHADDFEDQEADRDYWIEQDRIALEAWKKKKFTWGEVSFGLGRQKEKHEDDHDISGLASGASAKLEHRGQNYYGRLAAEGWKLDGKSAGSMEMEVTGNEPTRTNSRQYGLRMRAQATPYQVDYPTAGFVARWSDYDRNDSSIELEIHVDPLQYSHNLTHDLTGLTSSIGALARLNGQDSISLFGFTEWGRTKILERESDIDVLHYNRYGGGVRLQSKKHKYYVDIQSIAESRKSKTKSVESKLNLDSDSVTTSAMVGIVFK